MTNCSEVLKKLNPNFKVCSEDVCESLRETDRFHENCNSRPRTVMPVSTVQCVMPDGTHLSIDDSDGTVKFESC